MKREASPPPEIPGHTFVRYIAGGGHADVFLYRQKSPDREVAAKVLRDTSLDAQALRRFRDEADAMGKIDHPNSVTVYNSDVAPDGRPYLTMRYYPGAKVPDLAANLSVLTVLDFGVQIAGAVAAAHRAGVLHRDIKPANILTSDSRRFLLSDFGIAGRLAPGPQDQGFDVTVAWSSPEILAGGHGSPASDVYSLGATLWSLLAGRSPFEQVGGDNSSKALVRRICAGPVPRIERQGVPAVLNDYISRMLATNPADRPQTAEAVAESLQRIAEALVASGARRSESVDSRQPFATSPATASAVSTEIEQTRRPERLGPEAAEEPPGSEQESSPQPPRQGRIWAAAFLTVAATAVVVTLATGGSSSSHDGASGSQAAAASDGSSGSDPNAGQIAENELPGPVTVTASRLDPTKLRFTWTYSAQLATDTFAWRTDDGKLTGTAATPSMDVADPAGVRMCLQIKVVRADGSGATVEWSPAGCGN